jgi:hypothetical protein
MIILGTRQYEANQNGLILVVNFGNKPVLVPADVKDRAFLVPTGVRERLLCFRKIQPDCSSSHAIPRKATLSSVALLFNAAKMVTRTFGS